MVNVTLVLSQAQLAILAHALRSVQPHNVPTHVRELYIPHAKQNCMDGTTTQVIEKDKNFLVERFVLLSNGAPSGTHAMVL